MVLIYGRCIFYLMNDYVATIGKQLITFRQLLHGFVAEIKKYNHEVGKVRKPTSVDLKKSMK